MLKEEKEDEKNIGCRALLLHHFNSFIVILSLHFVLCCFLLHTRVQTNIHTQTLLFVGFSAFYSPTLAVMMYAIYARNARQILGKQLTMTENLARKRANEHFSEQIE